MCVCIPTYTANSNHIIIVWLLIIIAPTPCRAL